MIRTFFVFLYIFIYALSGILIWPLYGLLRLFNKKTADWMVFEIIHFSCRLALIVAGIQMDVSGLEYLNTNQPTVYILNHRSIFDVVIAYAYFNSPTGFVAKSNMKKVPFFHLWLLVMRGIFLDRKDIRDGARMIHTGVRYLKEGVSMAIFPEGTRNKNTADKTEIAEFHSGSFKLAIWSSAPIVPIVLYNTSAIFEEHKPLIRPTKVKMTVCPPIYPANLSKDGRRFIGKEVHAQMQQIAKTYEN